MNKWWAACLCISHIKIIGLQSISLILSVTPASSAIFWHTGMSESGIEPRTIEKTTFGTYFFARRA